MTGSLVVEDGKPPIKQWKALRQLMKKSLAAAHQSAPRSDDPDMAPDADTPEKSVEGASAVGNDAGETPKAGAAEEPEEPWEAARRSVTFHRPLRLRF